MIAKALRLPWGRAACVVGALMSFFGIGTSDPLPWALTLVGFLAAGVALHGLAIWRDKP